MKKGWGFTLIELMVTMSIVAILATAWIAAYTNYLKGARDSVRATVAREVATKVEAYSGIHGAPLPGQMASFLTTEGIAIKDPIGGRPVCVDANGQARMVCKINYHLFPDGTYAISYGVEKTKSLVNPHYSNILNWTAAVADTAEIYGSFIGNAKTLTIAPATPTTHLEAKPDLVGIAINASPLSSSGSYTNGAAGWGGGTPPGSVALGGACTANIDCATNLFCGINICTLWIAWDPCNNNNQCVSPQLLCNTSISQCYEDDGP